MEQDHLFENLSFSFFDADDYKESAREVLRTVFGHHDFRDQQEKIVTEVLEGRDALVLMPTGGGKSLCYQIPAIVRKGVGIVISPLISLMEDQVSTLNEMGVEAYYLNSSLSREESNEIEAKLRQGQVELLYLAPERLLQPYTLNMLSSIDVSVIAIDEAHCVSRWGPDFRPEYMNLNILSNKFPNVPRIALTATADMESRKIIANELSLKNARVFLSSFDRPNISYEIELKNEDPETQLLNFLERFDIDDSGIIYCLSRKKVEQTAAFLVENGFIAYPYHAGMSSTKRKKVQQHFLQGEGVIVVATIAFGMGIDKPDVRFVGHMDMPKSIESYYQETGRAARDGLAAQAWMLYSRRDSAVLKHLIRKGTRDRTQRKVEEHHIELMLGLCETTRCRREVILSFLDEDSPEYCGNCDVCQGSLEGRELQDVTDEILLYLTAIYKLNQKMSYETVISFLTGDESFRFHEYTSLPLYAQGQGIDSSKWREIHRVALTCGLIQVKFAEGARIALTEKSLKVLDGKDRIYMRLDTSRKMPTLTKKRAPKKKKQVRKRSPKVVSYPREENYQLDGEQRSLFNKLRALRSSIASKRKIPAYKVFHDTTLIEIVKYRPQTQAEFSKIHGVGKAKLKKYSKKFMDLI
ncbi:putative ATP-dependent DNA helicase [Halobacteriovorax marinus SJ]|uniref:DNA helicase RecQ n=1 Tax=Halobacteriovorax marinus (strain ATCC BAA-682 / DSM 15412 / SJ) TaxID=862908 RepID=E1WZQ0_HALMS|nr:DNA helicase RecQ [Halobacteriovorax marinus]CBW26236.1 putative ATP-dependent DNA helicase [Halobacteriovorax marinus SJ]